MKKYLIICFALAAVILLSSCSTGRLYISDINGISSNDNMLSGSANDMRPGIYSYTADGRYIYNEYYRIDILENRISVNCDKPLCNHDTTECDGEFFQEHVIVRAYEGGFYYTDGNILYYKKGDDIEKIYENNFVSDFEKDYEWTDTLGHFGAIPTDDGIICVGLNYFFKISYDGELLRDPVVAAEDERCSFFAIDKDTLLGDAYTFDHVDYMFVADLNDGTVTKIKDGADPNWYADNKIYYTTGNFLSSDIFTCDMDGENEKMILSGVSLRTMIEKTIYFCTASDRSVIYKYDTETGETAEVLNLPELAREQQNSGQPIDTITDLFGSTVSNITYFPNIEKILIGTYNADQRINFFISDKSGEEFVQISKPDKGKITVV
ncbi:MAG: DUF5050 domain-containing protein [Eubacterium sp.]|nr:DUF5050 domain-containing protein [Eubacterium sp.]